MPHDASGDVRLPHVNDLHPDFATFMIARTFAETYRDVLHAPIPDPLVAILRQMEIWEADHERLHPEPHVVLVVEDEPYVRELAGAVLEETDLDVVEVDSAEAALAYLKDQGGEVAMMFADVRLPGEMEGIQLAKTACTLWPEMRIVLTSGDPDAASDTCRTASRSCRSRGAALTCWSRRSGPCTSPRHL